MIVFAIKTVIFETKTTDFLACTTGNANIASSGLDVVIYDEALYRLMGKGK
jgi:hypothetical protein